MDNDELIALADRLEAATVHDNPRSQTTCIGRRRIVVSANRAALLRGASACLRAAAEDDDLGRRLISLKINQVCHESTDVQIFGIEHSEPSFHPPTAEELQARQKERRRSDQVALFGCAVFVLLSLFTIGSAIAYWRMP